MKILIADDDPTTRLILSQAAKQWGYEPAIAQNGDHAWEILTSSEPPQIALLDWMMPGKSGIELCQKLAACQDRPFVYTMIVTCKESRNERLTGLNSGAHDYLTKPIDPAELQSRLSIASRMVKMNQQLADDLEKIRKIEANLRISEQRLSSILKAVPDVIYRLDDQDRIVYINEAIRQYGYTEEELIGKNIFDLVHPDHRDRAMYHVNERRTGQRRTIGFELNMLDRQKQSVPVELSAAGVKLLPIFSLEAQGLYENPKDRTSFVGTQGIARDVTLRKQALSKLREANQRQQAIFQAAQNVGFILTELEPKARIQEFSPGAETIFQQEKVATMRQTIESLIAPASREKYQQMTAKISAGADQQSAQLTLLRDARKPFPAQCSLHAVKDENQQTTALLTVVTDLTERVKAEREKAQLEAKFHHSQKLESLGVLAGGIAHDFNNILVSIMGNADLALMDLPENSSIQREIQDIKRASQRAADLTEQMLAYSGKGRFIIQAQDINNLINDITEMVRASISKKIVLNYDLLDKLPAVEADATQIRQVIMNLLINASEAIGNNSGIITVRTSSQNIDKTILKDFTAGDKTKPGRFVRMDIIDTGSGMDDETLAKLFEPFFTTKFTGRGLGLSAVLGIIKGHRGGIRVKSLPGQGTKFTIILPASDQDYQPADKPSRAVSWSGSGKIIVIDDEPGVCEIAKSMLKKLGFEVLTAGDGKTGLNLYREHREQISAVLLDVSMPELSGPETLMLLRKIDPELRVALYSGYNEPDLKDAVKFDEQTTFMSKPFEFAKFSETIRQLTQCN